MPIPKFKDVLCEASGGAATLTLSRPGACVVAEKKVEMWYLCRRYSARQALKMRLVDQVVRDAELAAEAERWREPLDAARRRSAAPTPRSAPTSDKNRAISGLGLRGGRAQRPHR